jgi:hypothetical protein
MVNLERPEHVLARVRSDEASSTFMVDAFIYPGNSGGPVVVRFKAMAIAGTKSYAKAALIGDPDATTTEEIRCRVTRGGPSNLRRA